ncbi:methyltransferase domain-containing protein [Haloferula chungangensis]|uniref:Methyltransferase domain-containing protein n=1 Tax=Haloferula chungangensis TaxID=1048331 RepID=A0ABW2LCE6_9BACT
MSDPVRELYSEHRYPALSHAEAHPAVLCASARCAGVVSPALPESCRVLEIGCASGHHLLPLAAAYPESQFVGIDFSDTAIRTATRIARETGLENIRFEHADLCDWQPGEEKFDYIIAHGMLSWITDPAKEALLELVSNTLAPDGVACLSYNTLPGWSLRQEAAAMVKALPRLTPEGGKLEALLEKLATTASISPSAHARDLAAIFEDMRRKGSEILRFDELAPINDPLHFSQVIHWAGQKHLRYLSESSLPENLPPKLAPETLTHLQPIAGDPVLLQQTLDLLSGRTHRCSLFCHADCEMDLATTAAVTLHFSARLLEPSLPREAITGELVEIFHASLTAASPSARSVRTIMEECAKRLGNRWDPAQAAKAIASWLYQAARLGWVELRADETLIEPVPPERPQLSPLNRAFAGAELPLVDAFHQSCHFPVGHQAIVKALDGSRNREELATFAKEQAPDLHFDPWLVHLSARGLFRE